MPQTSYNYDPPAAIAGLIVEKLGSRGRYEQSEALPAGRLCELHTDGKLRLPQTASAIGKVLGGVPYESHLPPGGYAGAVGDFMIRVLRKGKMWVEYQGTAPAVETQARVMSSSTVATHRGKVTGDATSAGAGVEIYAVPGTNVIKVDTALGLALVEFNLPA